MSFADQTTVTGNVASGTTDSGNGVKGAAVYNSTPPTFTTGQRADAQCDANGNLKVTITNAVSSGTAGAPSSQVLTFQGIAGMTPVQIQPGLTTSGGAAYSTYINTATPAVQTVKTSAGNLYAVIAHNTTATWLYLKMWDSNAAVTLGSTPATWQFPIPPGGVLNLQLAVPRSFANGLKYAVTGGISLTDNTGVTVNTCIVDLSIN